MEPMVRHPNQVEAAGMETDQAPRVVEDLLPQLKTACLVAQINPHRRRVLLQLQRRVNSQARRDPRPLVRMIPSSARSNVRQRAHTMR